MIRLTAALLLLTFSMTAVTSAVADEMPVHTLPVADLKSEADFNVQYVTEVLEKLESDDKYDDVKKKVKRAGATLAVVAQVIATHPDAESAGVAAADLRDAGIAIRDAQDAAAAKAGLASAIKAYAGEASGTAVSEHEWKGLIGMHDMMEVITYRSSRLRRGVRRLREPQEDKLHAVAIAVLSVPMEADTHEVKDETLIPEWQKMSKASQDLAVKLAKAMAEENEEEAQDLYKSLGETCKACHTQFRHEEE
ncbi:Cytochrome C' [Polystyrenella longa]|uniref:Cytochrome C n=1 Tax=Polystyrenella longa TaxID=2528007 RepID=A0A518CPG2_9PLAN|nr:cytochrome c [Polystyrenella longa]QDU81115.1 Cytochrome C' [Polystyrenella longa]